MSPLSELIGRIGPLDEGAMRAARARQAQLTKPAGSLGRLEDLAIQLAGITGRARPSFPAKAIFVLAADHGVAAEGVSAYPPEVTAQMVRNFLAGGAAINVLARRAGARVVVADVGVSADVPPHASLHAAKVAPGTRNLAVGPAMSVEQALHAVAVGAALVDTESSRGLDLIATGEMGIGNSTAAAALVAAVTGRPAADVTGRGTGVDDAGWQRKVQAITRSLEINRPDPADPIDVLAKLGGFEIAGLVGVMLAGAARRCPVVLDGFIAGAAALVAGALCPAVLPHLVAGHCSAEPGHRITLAHLGLVPLLDLGLRLGEGTGAAIAMHLVDAAAALLDEMATFDEAGVATMVEWGEAPEAPP